MAAMTSGSTSVAIVERRVSGPSSSMKRRTTSRFPSSKFSSASCAFSPRSKQWRFGMSASHVICGAPESSNVCWKNQ